MTRFERAIARLDAEHAQDPRTEEVPGEGPVPQELAYARRMTAWLERLAPDASEPLRLAVRAQHLCRWRIPRDRFPMDRVGYLSWRAELSRLHAELAGELLAEVGYPAETIARVQALVRKRHLRSDPEAQLLEDAACLVFIETGLAAFAEGRDETQLLGVLRKTWAKMGERGRAEALALPVPEPVRALVTRALAESDEPPA